MFHGLSGLAKDTAYRVRVLTELTDTNDSTVKTTAASAYTKPVVVRHEDLSAWYIDGAPNYNASIGRIFAFIDINQSAASCVADINGGKINCPPRTLVSLNVGTGGTYSLTAVATAGFAQGTLPVVEFVIPSDTAGRNALGGEQVSRRYFASGSDDTMYVRWKKVGKAADQFESYLIQTRKADDDDDDDEDWVTTVVEKTEADDRHGMSDWIDYELSADELRNCHSGLDATQLAACRANSASGEYEVRIRIRTAVGTGSSRREIDGPNTPALSRTVGGGRSGTVTNDRIDHIGTGKLRVSWGSAGDGA